MVTRYIGLDSGIDKYKLGVGLNQFNMRLDWHHLLTERQS